MAHFMAFFALLATAAAARVPDDGVAQCVFGFDCGLACGAVSVRAGDGAYNVTFPLTPAFPEQRYVTMP